MAHAGEVKKSRRGRNPIARPVRWRRYAHLFLIVCEDEATEPAYFKTFLPDTPEETVYLRPIGTGLDPLGVVKRAKLERIKLEGEANREVDQVWVVFDKDDADREPSKTKRFNEAIQVATDEEFKLAFSNEVFELWLLLHLTDVSETEALPRTEVYRQLGEALRQQPGYENFQYSHKETPTADVVAAIGQVGDEKQALIRAHALLVAHGSKPLLETNPSTRVGQLVEQLRWWTEQPDG